jgi:acyl-coenzyme A thioesterase PaaI-like protein
VFTIEMKTSFMKAAKTQSGKYLVAKGELIQRTKKMAFTEGTVYDAQGQVCAHATGTFKYVPKAQRIGTQISELPTD